MADAYQVAKLVWLVIFLELRELYKKKISKVPTLTQYTMHLKQESSHLRPKVPKIQHNIQQSNLKHTIFGHKLKHNHLTRWIFYGILCQKYKCKKKRSLREVEILKPMQQYKWPVPTWNCRGGDHSLPQTKTRKTR